MQISPNPPSLGSSLATLNRPPASAADGKAKAPGETPPAAAVPEQEAVAIHIQGAAPAAAPRQDQAAIQPPEVFAEIWKNGVRIGAVYANGHAELPAGLAVATASGNGPMFARMRVDDISRQVGGEVRYVNMAALQLEQRRSQLRAAYGV